MVNKLENPPFDPMRGFSSGQLWTRIQNATTKGFLTKSLHPLTTSCLLLEEQEIPFQVRRLNPIERSKKESSSVLVAKKTSQNPFLPYEPDLFVADMSESHVGVLNKFFVFPHHLLLITRSFVNQLTWLDKDDFYASVLCLNEFGSLVFYNGGEKAGASQPHKHLQVVPLVGPDAFNLPLSCILPKDSQMYGKVRIIERLPYKHAFVCYSLEGKTFLEQSFQLWSHFQELALILGLSREKCLGMDKPILPYNLLFTSSWMMLVPRSSECFETISINALGFAGGLLVRNEQEWKIVKGRRPLSILSEVAFKR